MKGESSGILGRGGGQYKSKARDNHNANRLWLFMFDIEEWTLLESGTVKSPSEPDLSSCSIEGGRGQQPPP